MNDVEKTLFFRFVDQLLAGVTVGTATGVAISAAAGGLVDINTREKNEQKLF